MKNKRVLITGGAGFIGSHTCEIFLNANYDVLILDSLSEKTHFSNEFPDYLDPRVVKVKGNVLDENLLLDLLSHVDYVVHLAAEMDLNPDFSKFMNVNVDSTALIYELIVKYNLEIKKILIASTQFVYGDGNWECSKHGEFLATGRHSNHLHNCFFDYQCPICDKVATFKKNIEGQQNPPNHYALSKYFQEMIGIRLGRLYSIPTTCARYSIVHGPRQSLKNTYSGALRSLAICINFGLEIPTYEDNNSVRDFVSVYDEIHDIQFPLID
jgi:dTDP-L-rhamnose 4-epimerase